VWALSSGFFHWGQGEDETVGNLASRTFKAGGPGFRFNLLLTESAAGLAPEVGAMRRLLTSTSQHSASGMVVIRVADSGEGISPCLADRLFEPWVTTREEALGIGLSIVRTIVENHGGRIGVELQESPGAVFKIELPAIALSS